MTADHPDADPRAMADAYCLGGARRLRVDPDDLRARKQLIERGTAHMNTIQAFLYQYVSGFAPDMFVDIGVNYAECLVALPEGCAIAVKGFEANAALLPFIEATLAVNADLSDVTVAHRAVSARAGEVVEFFVDTDWSGKSSLIQNKNHKALERREVRTTTLDAEVPLDGSVRSLLVKVDVEGAEMSVFRGAAEVNRAMDRVIWVVEFDSRMLRRGKEDPAACIEELSRDFALFDIGRGGRLRPVASIDDLVWTEKSGIHTDLVLARHRDPAEAERFEAAFLDGSDVREKARAALAG